MSPRPRASQAREAEAEELRLEVQARRHVNALFFRVAAAHAELPDGTKVEVDTNMDGSTLVSVVRDGKPTITYSLTPHNLVAAVLAAEEQRR